MIRFKSLTTELLEILNDSALNNKHYWRYQETEHLGLIPVGHKSIDRTEGIYEEQGVSCLDNPIQLLQYLSDEYYPANTMDVVLFTGSIIGQGLDKEDIVEITEEEQIKYSFPLEIFEQFCLKADKDIYLHNINLRERAEYYYG